MLQTFIKMALSGSEVNEETRLNRVVLSVGQDIGRAVTDMVDGKCLNTYYCV